MKDQFIKVIKWFAGSADNEPGGASSKKLTGFFCFALVGWITIIWGIWAWIHDNWDLLEYVLTSLQISGLGALGINAMEKLKKKDNDAT